MNKNGVGIEVIEAYKEGCATFRHYSAAALNIRLSAIAQGIVLMTGAGFLIKESNLVYAQFASAFGLLFTLVLMFLHENYQRKCALFIDSTSAIEKQFKLPIFPVTGLHDDHNRNVHSFFGEILITKGLFILLAIGFIIMFLKASAIF
jgi:hypothetical protein